jgi:hypothetical protein
MSKIVTTDVGRFRAVVGKNIPGTAWLWECPLCEQWGSLSDDQMNGCVSVHCECGYHETHTFGLSLMAAMQAAILTGKPPTTEDDASEAIR